MSTDPFSNPHHGGLLPWDLERLLLAQTGGVSSDSLGEEAPSPVALPPPLRPGLALPFYGTCFRWLGTSCVVYILANPKTSSADSCLASAAYAPGFKRLKVEVRIDEDHAPVTTHPSPRLGSSLPLAQPADSGRSPASADSPDYSSAGDHGSLFKTDRKGRVSVFPKDELFMSLVETFFDAQLGCHFPFLSRAA